MTNAADEPWLNVLWQFADYAGSSRIKSAWQHATGRGVHVGIIDDGVDSRHAELVGQVEAGRSFDLVRGQAGFSLLGGTHGTAVAGVIGAAADGVGLVGVAPGSTIGMLKVGFGSGGLDLLQIALAQTAHFDVTNCSWGFVDNYVDPADTPGLMAMQDDIRHAALDGRGGLGSAVVFSAGNSRASGGWTSAHALQGQAEVITVASVDWRGNVSSFSTPGPSILVAAGGEQIWTLDATGDAGFTSGDYARVSGTSFAAPLVTGIIALMLEANPLLGLRDIQEILAVSAEQTSGVASRNAAHMLNGGGLAFSNDLGFGVAQADRAVRLAETWLIGAAAHNFHDAAYLAAAGNANGGGLDFSLGGMSVQKVTLSITLPGAAWGHVSLDLVSPGGTVSRLLDAAAATGGPDSGAWEFVSNAFWGEASAGTWHLRFTASEGTVIAPPLAQLELLGDAAGPARFVLTDALYARQSLVLGGPAIIDAAAATGALQLDLWSSVAALGGATFQLQGGAWAGTVIGGAGADWLAGTDDADRLWGGDGDDQLFGRDGADLLSGGLGSNIIDGGAGWDEASFSTTLARSTLGLDGGSLMVRGAGFIDRLTNTESLRFTDAVLNVADLRFGTDLSPVFRVNQGGREALDIATRYAGPVSYLQWELRSTGGNSVVHGTGGNDFIKLDGGGNAVDPGTGRDVIDAGPGSNFMLGSTDDNVFFLDGRGGQAAWNTIVGWHGGDQAVIWGWQPGISRMEWRAVDGAVGATGVTLHADLNNDGAIDVSLTWAGLRQDHLPQPRAMDGLLWFT